MPENNNLELWKVLKKTNPDNLDDIKAMMLAAGYTKGEVSQLLGIKKVSEKRNKADQLKEDVYTRSKLRTRMLFQHIEKQNLLSTLNSMREEEKHVIESLQRLGEISSTGPQPGENAFPLRLETLIYKTKEETPSLPLPPDDTE